MYFTKKMFITTLSISTTFIILPIIMEKLKKTILIEDLIKQFEREIEKHEEYIEEEEKTTNKKENVEFDRWMIKWFQEAISRIKYKSKK